MPNLDRNPRRNQRGFTVAEVVVATAVFALIFVAALILYDRSNDVFKKGMESADMQQNTRVAFDKLVQDVRMAGFDYDRDGNPSGAGGGIWQPGTAYTFGDLVIPSTPNGFSYEVATPGTSGGTEPATWNMALAGITEDPPPGAGLRWRTTSAINQYQQPDEQVEHAGPTSLVVRGNFDFEVENAATQENGRETAYQSAQFPVVTTGNDEIVAYGLVSRNAAMNTGEIRYFADVNAGGAPSRRAYPGGTEEREVIITGVDLTNNNPPYTLFRFTLADDGSVVRSPLAENIRSLNFTYFQDSAGQQFLTDLNDPPRDVRRGDSRTGGTDVLGLGQFNPNNPLVPVGQRSIRKRIQSVLVQLQGMNPERDASFTDPNETLAGVRNYRKFNLQSLVTPRNIGKRGMREQDTKEPGNPTILRICVGHCGIVRVEWAAPAVNATSGAVEQFAILYDTIPASGSGPPPAQMGITTTGFIYGLTPNVPYRFRVQAINSWGARTSTNFIDATPLNRTKPNPPSNLLAVQSNRNILLSWDRPTGNAAGSLSCTDATIEALPNVPAAELTQWRVWRSTIANFNPFASPAPANLVVLWDETRTGAGQPVMNTSTGEVRFVDPQAACGVQYYYRVAALDSCRNTPALNDGDPTVIGGISDPFPITANPAYNGSFTIASPAAPKAPINLDSLDTSGCVGGICTVNLEWDKVTADTLPPPPAAPPNTNSITVDRYVITRVQKKMILGVETTIGSPTLFTVDGSSSTSPSVTKVSYTDSGVVQNDVDSLPFIYDYTVAAEYCGVASGPSNMERFPCVFAGGTPVVSITGAIDGDGISTPWLLDAPQTVSAVYAPGVTNLSATLTLNGVTIGTPIILTSPTSPTNIPIPDLNDGEIYVLTITMRDGNRCTHTEIRTLTGSPTGCCLNPFNVDPTVMTASGNTISLRLRNLCDDTLAINSITYRFNRGSSSNAFRLTDIRWPGALDVTPNQPASLSPYTAVRPAAATATIPRGTTYTILLIFNRNVTAANLDEFTGNYTRPLNESCRIVPSP